MSTSTRERLEEILRSPIESEADAERAREAAELLRELIAVTRRAEALLSGDPSPRGSGSLAGLSLHDAAERVLEDVGMPLHARDLGARIKAAGWRHPRSKVAKPHQIAHSLAAVLPKKPRFRRVAPQTFGLAKWDEEGLSPAARPTLGLFRGGGEPTGRRSADSVGAVEDAEWRSS